MHQFTASQRIKNTLSYKIGLELIHTDKKLKEKNTLIKFTLGGGAYLYLIYKLYHIKQQHYKELKLYKQIIKIFPELQRAKLETLPDYNEAALHQFHLAYLLGQAFIKADKTWYKGGYLKVFKFIKEAKLLYKNFLHIKDTIQHLDINKDHILTLLKQGQNFYFTQIQKLSPKLFHQLSFSFKDLNIKSFEFILTHIDTIQNWLASTQFKEHYLDTKHPYPPLLDCDLLQANLEEEQKGIEHKENRNKNKFDKTSENNTDQDEFNTSKTLSYTDIEAEVAWDLNLALPKKYKFIYFRIWGCANHSTFSYLHECGFIVLEEFSSFCDNKERYFYFYYRLLGEKARFVISILASRLKDDKILYLLDAKAKVFMVLRDPFGILKTWANHTHPNQAKINPFNLSYNPVKILDSVAYDAGKCPNVEAMHYGALAYSLRIYEYLFFFKNREIIAIDAKDLVPQAVMQTFTKLSKILNFKMPENENYFKDKKNSSTLHFLLPLTLILDENDIDKIEDLSSLSLDEKISVIIATPLQSWRYDKKEFRELEVKANQECKFFISKNDYEKLQGNKKLFDFSLKYLQKFLHSLDERLKIEAQKQINEKDILEYFYENKEQRKKYQKIFKQNFDFFDQRFPQIVQSWNYYQNFNQLCEELDEKV